MATLIFTKTFDGLFYLLYPLLKNPILVTYVAILFVTGGFVWFFGLYLKKNKAKLRLGNQKLLFRILFVLEGYLIVFLIWYIFVFFPTYRIFKP